VASIENNEKKKEYESLLETSKTKEQRSGKFQEKKKDTEEMSAQRILRAEEEEVRIKGLKEFFIMRRRWSWLLMALLVVILLFNVLLVILVGLGWLNFVDEWFLRIVLTTNLADIIGLVYLVVKFLFRETSSK
jgi:hypothetical protein